MKTLIRDNSYGTSDFIRDHLRMSNRHWHAYLDMSEEFYDWVSDYFTDWTDLENTPAKRHTGLIFIIEGAIREAL